MYLIVGLGNPESEYAGTRHNMGFDTINAISEKIGIEVKTKKFNSLCGTGKIKDENVILVKPQTYMNSSGEAIIQFKNFYKISNDKIIVIYDDIDLKVGEIRIKKQGSSGTHNGMKSVIEQLNTEIFPRVRIGVGKPEKDYDLIKYVIGKITKEEKEKLKNSVNMASEGVIEIVENGIEKAMNEFNGRKV